MSIRIIAGKFGGRIIATPDKHTTHPTGDRIRSSLFNIINGELVDAVVLDVFAGSGSLGLEAISRGAKSATFVERDRVASAILAENIKSLGVVDKTTTKRVGVSTWIDKNQGNFYDIIFADPPYNDLQLSTIARLGGLLNPNGLMVLSYPGKGEVPSVNGIVVVDNRSYGNAALAFYRKNNNL